MEEIIKKFRINKDLHTHTIYSRVGLYFHGKGRIIDNVRAAHEKGLTELAITDHGPTDLYGLNEKKIPKMRAEIAEAQAKYPDVKVYLGVEADIVNSKNGIDIKPENIGLYDFINAGYHYVPNCRMLANYLVFHLPCPKMLKAMMCQYNTGLVLRALYSNDIKVLTHPGDKAYVDMDAIGKACEETGTLLEINARHKRPDTEDLRCLAKYAVDFIIGSDAHKPGKVGRYAKSVALALAAGIETWRIVNLVER
ncbi:MAG: PHP domain-containing protein [Clostridiales bacterium]|nr:PHP domain-containing protein [Candidatus Crickella caballi]